MFPLNLREDKKTHYRKSIYLEKRPAIILKSRKRCQIRHDITLDDNITFTEEVSHLRLSLYVVKLNVKNVENEY